jgi:hypothetical protein
VDEAKKALFEGQSVKSFDFLVYSADGPNLLVDVKGRKFPDSGRGARRGTSTRAWENWITRGDVDGLTEWEKVFGTEFVALLVFAYWLQGPPQRAPFADVHVFRMRHYAFVGIPLAEYVTGARPRSARWGTIAMPSARFAEAARDVADFL